MSVRDIDARASVLKTVEVKMPEGQGTVKVEVTEGSEIVGIGAIGPWMLSLLVREPIPHPRKTVGHVLQIASQDAPIPALDRGRQRRLLGMQAFGPVHFIAYIDEPA